MDQDAMIKNMLSSHTSEMKHMKKLMQKDAEEIEKLKRENAKL